MRRYIFHAEGYIRNSSASQLSLKYLREKHSLPFDEACELRIGHLLLPPHLFRPELPPASLPFRPLPNPSSTSPKQDRKNTDSVLGPLLRYETDNPSHSCTEDAHDDQAPERSSEDCQTRLTRSEDGGDEEGLVSNFGYDLERGRSRRRERRGQLEKEERRGRFKGLGENFALRESDTDDHEEGLPEGSKV